MARPRQVSDDDILSTARSCFLEHGPSVSTAVIANHLGVSQAALFKRFSTKEELMLAALMPPEIPGWIARVDRGPGPEPIPDQLMIIAADIAMFFAEMTPCMATLKASGIDLARIMCRYEVPPPLRGVRALTQWLQQAMDDGRIAQGDPQSLAMMFVGSLHGRAFLTHILQLKGLQESSDYLTNLVDTLWRGIAPAEER